MKEHLIFETVNCDGECVLWDFDSFDEINANWFSDDCTLPSLDDELVSACIQFWSDFTNSWHQIDIEGKTFNDLIIAIGLED